MRVSRERAAKNGYSLGAQEQEVLRFVEYKGWTLVDLCNIMASLAEFEGRVIYERLSKGKRRKAGDEKAPTRNGGAWRPSTIRGMPAEPLLHGTGRARRRRHPRPARRHRVRGAL